MNKVLFLMGLFALSFCFSGETKEHQPNVSEDLAQVLWNVMETYEGEYSLQELFTTLWKLNTGKIESKPIEECYHSLLTSMEIKAAKKSEINLQAANSYLQNIKQLEGFHELIDGKLYYRVIEVGSEQEIGEINDAPLISFTEKTMDGKVLSKNPLGIRLPLSETIIGLREGIKGMRTGEKRELHIHPNLAYEEFPKPEPNSIIIIEVTLISP